MESRHDRTRPIEHRLICCDGCGRTIVLAYERNVVGVALASSVITVVFVQCPWGHCNHEQAVLVPYEGQDVRVDVWLGQPRTSSHRRLGRLRTRTSV